MPSFESNLYLNKNSIFEGVLHPFVTFPSAPVPGQVGYNANISENRPFFFNGSQWLPFNHIPNESLTNALWSSNPIHALSFEKLATPTANFNFGNVRITNLASPVNDQDAVNKAYADGIRETLDFKNSVRVATTTALPSSTYNNGSGTITGNSNGSINTIGIDGITDLAVGNRILVKDQLNQVENGIYTITQLGSSSTPFILTRSTDANTGSKLTSGSTVYVEDGTVNISQRFTLVTPGTITLGSSNLIFQQTSGLGQVVDGVGLVKTGNTLNVNLTGSNTITSISDSLRVRSSATQFQVLRSVGSSSGEAVWDSVHLNQPAAISGTLPITNGGTGATTAQAAFNSLSPATLAGEMIWFNGTNNVPVPRNSTSNTLFLSQVSSGQPTWTQLTTDLITTSHTAVNYNPANSTLLAHIAALDTAVGVAMTSGGITKLIDDLNPQLGGNLDVNGFVIGSANNNDITITPDGSGRTIIGDPTNHIRIDTNTSNLVQLTAAGSEPNIGVVIEPKGTGLIRLGSSVTWPTNTGSAGDVLIRQGASGTIFGTLASNQIAANRTPINYSATGNDLKSHLDGIDAVLGNVSNTPFRLQGDANPILGGNLNLDDFNINLKDFRQTLINIPLNASLLFSVSNGAGIQYRPTSSYEIELSPFRFIDPTLGDPDDPTFTAISEAIFTLNLRSRNRFQRVRIEGLAYPISDGLPGQALVTNGLGELSFAYVGPGTSTTINNIGTFVSEINNSSTNIVNITHPFQTQNLVVTVMRTDNYRIVYPEILYPDINTVRLIFSNPPGNGVYRAIVQAAATINLRRFFFDINDTINTSIVITHNLGTRDVTVDVYQRVPVYRRVFVQIEATTINTVTLTFSNPPGSNVYRVMVTG